MGANFLLFLFSLKPRILLLVSIARIKQIGRISRHIPGVVLHHRRAGLVINFGLCDITPRLYEYVPSKRLGIFNIIRLIDLKKVDDDTQQ